MTAPSSPSWWQQCWARRKPIAAGIGAVLMLACPLLPAQAQIPCRAAQTGLRLVLEVAGDADAPSSPTSPSSPAGCVDNQVQSVPNFCKCRGGRWTDYFDADAGCGG